MKGEEMSQTKSSTATENTTRVKPTNEAIDTLKQTILKTLETYANVHRGSGHHSMVSTHLYEQARSIVLEYLGLSHSQYLVIFCSPRQAELIKNGLRPYTFTTVSSQEIGINLGVVAMAVTKRDLSKVTPPETGGGTTRLYDKNWVNWTDAPDKFEAGTPAIINVIAFARALLIAGQNGNLSVLKSNDKQLSVEEILHQDNFQGVSGWTLLTKLRENLIGRDILVPTADGDKPFINFDNSASTPTFKPILDAFHQTIFQSKEIQKNVVQEVKSICAKFVSAPLQDYEIIFTSNTTESVNIVADNLSIKRKDDIEPVLLVSMLEHSSNDLPWRNVPGLSILRLKVNNDGFWDVNELEKILDDYNKKKHFGKKRIVMVSLSGASNVLGTCNNLEEAGNLVHRYNAHFMVDAAQLIAHRKVNMKDSQIDVLAFSAHKAYAPFGCGVLVAKKGILKFDDAKLKSIKLLGEENPGGIAALGKSLLLLQRIGFDAIGETEQKLLHSTLSGLKKIEGVKIFGMNDLASKDLVHKIGVTGLDIKNMAAGAIAQKLAYRKGIGVRIGCHCAHLIVKQLAGFNFFIETLQRIVVGLFPNLTLQGFLRVSFGIQNTEEEVDILLEELENIARREKPLKSKSPKSENKEKQNEIKEGKKRLEEFIQQRSNIVYGKTISS